MSKPATTSLYFDLLTKTLFPKIWTIQILSQVSLNLVNFLLILRIFEATGSTVAISLVWLFYAMPVLILGPFAGTISDLFSKRSLMFTAISVQAAAVLFYLPIQARIWPIYLVVFLYGIISQVYIPAESSMMVNLVPKRLLAAANSLFVFTIYASFLLGFGLAGPLVRMFGKNIPFLIISGLLVFGSFLIRTLPKDERAEKVRTPDLFWQKLTEGYSFLKRNPTVLFPLILLALTSTVVQIIAVLAPAITVKVFGIDLLDASTQVILPVGAGAVLGAFGAVRLLRWNRKKRVITRGIFVAAISLAILGLGVPNIESKTVVGTVALFFLGLSFPMVSIPSQTLMQERTPEGFRGRVFGTLGFLMTGFSLLPVLFSAALTEVLSEVALIVALSAIIFSAGIISLKPESLFRIYLGKR